MFSSKTDQWSTPQNFFDELNKEFNFTLDPCADEFNHKCDTYFTQEQDGLNKNWGRHNVFCNPPYGRAIKNWVKKCYEESKKPNTTVVMLIPARTDTSYFHDYIYHKAKEIRFIKGRLKFQGENKLLNELKEVLDYNPTDGVFIWKKDIYKGKGKGIKVVNKGDIAGCLNHDGYRYIKYNGKKYSEHRLAYLFIYNESPKYIDHIDRNKQNNRIENLRKCSKNQNGQNRSKMSNNTSGYKGVHFDKRNGKFASQIRNNGKLEWLGYFATREDAAKAYDQRALEIFGEFANLNFETEVTKFGNSTNSAPFPSMVVIF